MQFDYFFRATPQVKSELECLGIQFVAVTVDDQDPDGNWPGLQLPSGAILAIARDDEGNGPGAIHVFTKDQLEPPKPNRDRA